jgi:hypothetical protein
MGFENDVKREIVAKNRDDLDELSVAEGDFSSGTG